MWRHKHVLTVERIIGNKRGDRRLGRRFLPARDARQAHLPGAVGAEDRSLSLKALFSPQPPPPWPAAFRGTQPSFVARCQLRGSDAGVDRRRPLRRPQVGQGDGRGLACCPGRGRTRRARHRAARRDRLCAEYPRIAGPAVRRGFVNPWPIRVLTSDGEFHSARRQLARWEEAGAAVASSAFAVEPFDSFSERFLAAARSGDHDFIFVSQVLFGSGRMFERGRRACRARPARMGPWVVIDGYHAFMALDRAVRRRPPRRAAFYLGGGYKYAMAGEGCAFMHAPPGFGRAPAASPAGLPSSRISPCRRAASAMPTMPRRFLGATFDPSALYRFIAVRRMLAENGLTTARISEHVAVLQQQLLDALADTALRDAELLNPLDGSPHARFLAFRSARRAALVFGAEGAELHHRRARRRAADRLRRFIRTRRTSTGSFELLGGLA